MVSMAESKRGCYSLLDIHDRLVIIGASGHGKVVADIARRSGRYRRLLFLDDDPAIGEAASIPVAGDCSRAGDYLPSSDIFVAVGNAAARRRITERLLKEGARIPALVHPQATVGFGVEIASGTAVMAGAVVNADARVGRGCIINTCASVDHDCIVGDYAHIAVGAHLAGSVCIGEGTWIGAGATVINNVSVDKDITVGAGAVVTKSLHDAGVYVGVPAHPVMYRDKEGICL